MPTLVVSQNKYIHSKDLQKLRLWGDVVSDSLYLVSGVSSHLDVKNIDEGITEVCLLDYNGSTEAVSLLDDIYKVLPALGKLSVTCGTSMANELNKKLLFAGFSNCKKEDTDKDTVMKLLASKPDWRAGYSMKLNFASSTAKDTVEAWDINSADDQIDEEDLLANDIVEPQGTSCCCTPVANYCDALCYASAVTNAKPKKKACKNCTCGAASETPMTLTKEMLESPQSGCGSCGLGDAYRCSTCPYRGLPKFELGKKVELPSSFLDAEM